MILANFLFNRIEWIVTFDGALLHLEKLTIDGGTLGIIAPRDISLGGGRYGIMDKLY